jgi:hypothetical protein
LSTNPHAFIEQVGSLGSVRNEVRKIVVADAQFRINAPNLHVAKSAQLLLSPPPIAHWVKQSTDGILRCHGRLHAFLHEHDMDPLGRSFDLDQQRQAHLLYVE